MRPITAERTSARVSMMMPTVHQNISENSSVAWTFTDWPGLFFSVAEAKVHRQMPTDINTTEIYSRTEYVFFRITMPSSMLAIREPLNRQTRSEKDFN